MHATVSGCGDNLAIDDADAIDQARLLFSYLPSSWRQLAPVAPSAEPLRELSRSELPADEAVGYDMREMLDCIVDADSLYEIKPLFAPEIITGFARLDGHTVGVVASNPANKGGVLFVDSADKAARFVWMCDAYNVPLLFLADVPGFMIGTQVERQGIIRHGAKMVAAVTEATVPKISVIVRKAYGAGLYAFSGPAFNPIATLALPTAKIAVMGPEAAVNAVYANRIAAIDDPEERKAYVLERRNDYEDDVNLYRLAGDLHVDGVVPFEMLRDELINRFSVADPVDRQVVQKRHAVLPV
jgi:acetyl-CoA carboxylase carboxyltransferase component